jgi:threonine/homoserine/homoserine lactone efflux protein
MWLDAGLHLAVDKAPPQRAGEVYRQSVIANVLNPKVGIFFVSFLPRFVDSTAEAPGWQFATLGLAFALQAWVCFSLVALAAGWLGERLLRNERAAAWLTRIAGAVLIALGVSLAWPEG